LHIPIQKWPLRAANLLAAAINSPNLPPQSLDPDELMETASRKLGLTDFGDPSFLEPFRLVIEDILRDPHYHRIGTWFHRKIMLTFLMNRLRVAETFRRQPELSQIDVGRPLIIIGLPRTGTSHLMNILSQDPDHRTLSFWEISEPVPAPHEDALWRDPRRYYYAVVLQLANYLVPALRSVHNVRLDGPEECILLLANSFRSHFFIVEYSAPAYLEWLKTCDYRPAYLEHKQQLQILQSGIARKRWLLKAPSHMDGIEGLLDVYPDAMIIHTHRDPLKALPSICSLALATRSVGLNQIDQHDVGREMTEHLACAMDNYIKVRDERGKPGQFLDIMYEDLVDSPLDVVRQIYDHFGLDLTESALAPMEQELSSNPRNKHGSHNYTLEQFGLDADALRERFGPYMARFGVSTST